MFQQFNLFPHLSALQNCMLAPVRLLGLSKAEAKGQAMALLERVGLANAGVAKVGEQQSQGIEFAYPQAPDQHTAGFQALADGV